MIQPRPRASTDSQGDHVFQALAGELLRGRYAAGSRLPSERELAQRFGTSRSTLREAVRRLESLGLLKARRGSGLEVRDMFRHGSISLLPAWLRVGAPGVAPAVVLLELLRLRRLLLAEVVRMCSLYAAPEGLAAARTLLDAAWAVRDDRSAFLRADYEFAHALTTASGFAPAAWLLNAFEQGYIDLASTVAAGFPTPRDYLRAWSEVLEAVARRDADRAVAAVRTYLDKHDEKLLKGVGLK
jgi:GntR family transcriptional regulator, transcriptional repressor for pyruvate dehydrogenase complex